MAIDDTLLTYFDSVQSVELIKRGFDNENYFVDADGQRYVLRIYNVVDQPRTKESILEEITFINFFHDHGVKTPKALQSKAGELVSNVDERFCAVFEFCKGDYIYGRLNATHFEEVGELMGKIHHLTEENRLTTTKLRHNKSTTTDLFDTIKEHPEVLSQNDLEHQQKINDNLSLFEQAPLWFTHNDYHFGNILFDGDNLSALLDFDSFTSGHFANDIARFLLIELSYSPLSDYHVEQTFIDGFFKGYQSQRQLTEVDKQLTALYFDIHFLFQKIRLSKANPDKVPEFTKEVAKLKEVCTIHL